MPPDTPIEDTEPRAGRIPGEPSAHTTLVALLVVLFVLIIAAIVVAGSAGMSALSGIRAFVTGQSNWSKAQKDAVYSLARYLDTADEVHYRNFQARLTVPRGDRKARIAMTLPTPDLGVAVRGFLEGLNSPADADDMVAVLARYRDTEHFQRALQIWQRGDDVVDELEALGIVVHQDVEAGRITPEVRSVYDVKLDRLNDRAADLEDAFSGTLGQASRSFRARLIAAVGTMTLDSASRLPSSSRGP